MSGAASTALYCHTPTLPRLRSVRYGTAGYERAGYERAGYERTDMRTGYERAGYERTDMRARYHLQLDTGRLDMKRGNMGGVGSSTELDKSVLDMGEWI